MGLSGGIDSSYLLHKIVSEYNLSPLVFHVDAGWNSQISSNNIQRLVEKLKLELFTEVINWKEMKDLQISFFKSEFHILTLHKTMHFLQLCIDLLINIR